MDETSKPGTTAATDNTLRPIEGGKAELDAREKKAEETPYEPVFTFRELNGRDTLKIYRIVTGLGNNDEIRNAAVEGGMEAAQYAVIRTLFDQLEGEFMPLMVSMVEGNKDLFKLPRKLDAAEVEEGETEAQARARIVEERLEEWLEGQHFAAPIDLFNDFVSREDFLAVFVSASRSANLLKRVGETLGIDFARLASLARTPSSTDSPSAPSSESSTG